MDQQESNPNSIIVNLLSSRGRKFYGTTHRSFLINYSVTLDPCVTIGFYPPIEVDATNSGLHFDLCVILVSGFPNNSLRALAGAAEVRARNSPGGNYRDLDLDQRPFIICPRAFHTHQEPAINLRGHYSGSASATPSQKKSFHSFSVSESLA
jgi:hypothetical protein